MKVRWICQQYAVYLLNYLIPQRPSDTAVDLQKPFGQEKQYSNFGNLNYSTYSLMKSMAKTGTAGGAPWYENRYHSFREIRLPTKTMQIVKRAVAHCVPLYLTMFPRTRVIYQMVLSNNHLIQYTSSARRIIILLKTTGSGKRQNNLNQLYFLKQLGETTGYQSLMNFLSFPTSLTSLHLIPSPEYPGGHSPHLNPSPTPGVSSQSTKGKHGFNEHLFSKTTQENILKKKIS